MPSSDLLSLVEQSLFLSRSAKARLASAIPALPKKTKELFGQVLEDALEQQGAYMEVLLARDPSFLKNLKAFVQGALRKAYTKAESEEAGKNQEKILKEILDGAES